MKLAKNETPKTVYWLDNKLYLNITNQCSNCCFFCLRNFKRGVGGFNLKLSEEPSVEQIICELGKVWHMRSWDEVVFCGFGEPTERLDVLLEVTRWIRQHYGRPLKIRVNTNGHGYALNMGRDVATELKTAGVDRVSVSLNAGDKETYNEICKPTFADTFEAVIDFINKTKSVLEVEVTVVRMPEVDVPKAKTLADGLDVSFRVREYIPCFY
ncbi:MAG: TatD family nuclease-associated radical SAM protein [Candidatus Bathyarchaeia archaeon]|jgi:TatD family-associated radical SAM protein